MTARNARNHQTLQCHFRRKERSEHHNKTKKNANFRINCDYCNVKKVNWKPMSSLQKSVLKSRLPPAVPSSARSRFVGFFWSTKISTTLSTSKKVQRRVQNWNWKFSFCLRYRDGSFKKNRQKDYSPTMWNEYFHEQKDIKVDDQHVFRVYLSRSPEQESGPLLVLLHGGGFSALTWSLFVVSISNFDKKKIVIKNCLPTRLKSLQSYIVNAWQSIWEVTVIHKQQTMMICRQNHWLRELIQ